MIIDALQGKLVHLEFINVIIDIDLGQVIMPSNFCDSVAKIELHT